MIVGGNVDAVRGLATELDELRADIDASRDRLDDAARALVPAAWSGAAADGFAASWGSGDVYLAALGRCYTELAAVLRTLADGLSAAQRLAHQVTAAAAAAGVPLDADGDLLPVLPARFADPAYRTEQESVLALVAAARSVADRAWWQADAALVALVRESSPGPQMGPTTAVPSEPGPDGIERLQGVVQGLDVLHSLYTAPAAVADKARIINQAQRARINDVERAWRDVKRAGDRGLARDLRQELRPARAAKYGLSGTTKAAGDLAGRFPYADLLATPLKDLGRVGRFVENIPVVEGLPVVGVGLSALGTGLDIAGGMNPSTAIASNVAGIVATEVVFDLAGGALVTGAAVGAAPVLLTVGASMAVGAGVSWTVREISEHGFVGGVQDMSHKIQRVGRNPLVDGLSNEINRDLDKVWHALFH